ARGAARIVVARVQRADARADGASQRFDVAQPAAFGLERGLLLDARRRALDLRQLPLEQVQLAVTRAGPLAQRFQPLRERPLAGIGARVALAPRSLIRACEAVEDLELCR